MHRFDISQPRFTYDPADPPGFRSGLFRMTGDAGAERTGTTVYELPPGEAVCPYHYEYGEEEWMLVLEGSATVRTPEGTQRLSHSEIAFFPTGASGAHQVRNEGNEPVRILMWSNVVLPTATAYPDSDKVGIYTGIEAEDVMVPRSSAVDYFHGETGD
jgi:uncharacterized cupin superfamily protein